MVVPKPIEFVSFWHVAPNRLKIQFVKVLGTPKYLKMVEKTLKKYINFGRFKPMKLSRVITGKSRVNHGLITGSGNPGFVLETRGFVLKSRVTIDKLRVDHG